MTKSGCGLRTVTVIRSRVKFPHFMLERKLQPTCSVDSHGYCAGIGAGAAFLSSVIISLMVLIITAGDYNIKPD